MRNREGGKEECGRSGKEKYEGIKEKGKVRGN